jgi:hypothetical protein
MDTLFNILKKSLVFSTILVFTFVFTYVPQHHNQPHQALAFGDIDPDLPTLIPIYATTAISATADSVNTTKETVLDGIASAIRGAIVSTLVASTLNWINSGFEGSPAFVQDLRRTLLEVADIAAGEFIAGIGEVGSFICSPFQLDIQIALAIEYQRIRENRPLGECRITEVIDNIEDFYDGVSSGGLEDWIAVTQNPSQYTPYGQLLTAQEAMQMNLLREEEKKRTELNWGQGIQSGKICETIEGPRGSKINCIISKPGRVIAEALNKSIGAGQDQLIAADEINEIVGALIGQLARKAITGSAGLLGLSSGTGYTYTGFAGGSYLNAAVAESNELVSTVANSTGVSSSGMSDSLIFHNNLVPLADSYAVQFTNYANNTTNSDEQRSAARVLAQNAITVKEKALELIPKISALVGEYQVLEAEKGTPGVSNERLQEIAQLQAKLYSDFVALRPYDAAQVSMLEESWRSVLGG